MKTPKKSNRKAATTAGKATHPPPQEQPLLKSQAAVQGGMFLFTDDRWSLAYFDRSDLHYEERELLG
jgi:hypothetical protein